MDKKISELSELTVLDSTVYIPVVQGSGDSVENYKMKPSALGIGNYLPLTGGTIDGNVTFNGEVSGTPYITEDFDDGLIGAGFTNDLEHPWTISYGSEHTATGLPGYFSIKSGVISDNSKSEIKYSFTPTSEVSLFEFYYYVSTEGAAWDTLVVTVNDVAYFRASVDNLATKTSFYIYDATPKVITFKFVKDGNSSVGNDAVWVTNIKVYKSEAVQTNVPLSLNSELYVQGRTILSELVSGKDLEIIDDNKFGGLFIGSGEKNLLYPRNISNLRMGTNCFSSNQTGVQNIAFGPGVLKNNTTGSQNISIGWNSLIGNVSGNMNTALGIQSIGVAKGNQNTAIGAQALFNFASNDNYSSINNVGIGYRAGFINGTNTYERSNITLIGSNTRVNEGLNQTITNSTAIGQGALITKSNQVVIGDTNVTEVKINGSVVGNVLPTKGTNYLIVKGDKTATENFDNLYTAYQSAKQLASMTNIITILVAPGIYENNSGNLVFDTDYINVISLDGECSVILTGSYPIVDVNSNNSYIKGFNCSYGKLTVGSGLNLTTIDKCKGGLYSFGSTELNTISSTFIDCEGTDYCFGSYGGAQPNGSVNGKFIRCKAGSNSFGFGCSSISATFIDCECTGTSNFGCNVSQINSGKYINCTSGSASFGYYTNFEDVLFKNCVGGTYCFGAGVGTIYGDIINCIGGQYSFGENTSGGGYIQGKMMNCICDRTPFARIPDGSTSAIINCYDGLTLPVNRKG